MMGRETGVPTAGVGLRRSAGETTGALVRPLGDGPSERIHLMNRRDVSACWRSSSKQGAKTQNKDPLELSASKAESNTLGHRPLKNTQHFTVLDDRSPAGMTC
jgi:hypothetical protein